MEVERSRLLDTETTLFVIAHGIIRLEPVLRDTGALVIWVQLDLNPVRVRILDS